MKLYVWPRNGRMDLATREQMREALSRYGFTVESESEGTFLADARIVWKVVGVRDSALSRYGSTVKPESDGIPSADDQILWSVRVRESECVLNFMERGGKFLFATLTTRNADASETLSRLCEALVESLGWQTDGESVD